MLIEPVVIEPDVEDLEPKHETQKALTRFYHDDISVDAKLRFRALKTLLEGAKIIVLPTIHAAMAPAPEKPPPMKYTDLPLYKSPHKEYNEYEATSHECPKAKVKVFHEFLYPHVSCFRKQVQKTYQETRCAIRRTAKDICSTFCEGKKDFKNKMRCPENMLVRQSVLALGGVVGYLIGGGRGIPRRLFFTGAGVLLSGALCFPEETDEAFRNISYYTGKVAIGIYNFTCNKGFAFKERLVCQDDLPPPPLPRTQNPCPKQ